MPNGSIVSRFKNEVDRQKVIELVTTLNSASKKFIDVSLEEYDIDVKISNFLFEHIAKSYYLDITKYKKFHNYKEDINCYKVSSYLVKWILKVKPIFIINPGTTTQEKNISLKINEVFAFELACIICKISSKDINKNTKDRIIYNLHYRDYNVGIFNILLEHLA